MLTSLSRVRVLGLALLCALSLSCTSDDGLLVPFAPPTLTSVAADAGVQGSTTTVTITGTNFVPGATNVRVSGEGVSASSVSVANPTSLTATLTIAAGAATGAREVTVVTAGGTSGARSFTVRPPPPTLSGITPASLVRGATATFTLTGTNFIPGATTVAVGGADVTVGSVTVTGGTSLTVALTAGAAATLGARTVSVTTPGGTSGTQSIQILPPAPTLTAIAPAAVVAGSSTVVTLTGTNFVAGATVTVGGTGITVSDVVVVNATTITMRATVAADAAAGARPVSVTTPGGTTAPLSLSVDLPTPTISSITPGGGVRGTLVVVTITGTNFASGSTTITLGGSGVTASNVTVTSPTTLTAWFDIAASAALGARAVTVTTPGGTSEPGSFIVFPQAPTLTSITPNDGTPGSVRAVTLTGTNFVGGATSVGVSGSGVTVSGVTVVSATTITAVFTVAGGATLGPRSITVTTSGGTTNALPFTVVAAPAIQSFAASATVLVAAQPTELTWATTNATTCSIDQGVGAVPCNSSVVVTPGVSRTYTLSASAGGQTVTAQVSVTVGAAGQFLYAAASTADQLLEFRIGPGLLLPIGATPVSAPTAVVFDPSGLFGYVTLRDVNSVESYQVNPTTGALTFLGSSPTGTMPRQVVMTPSGRFVYVLNQVPLGPAGSVSMYERNGAGQLMPRGAVGAGAQPSDITIDGLGRYLYVSNFDGGSISMFAINADGTLTGLGTLSGYTGPLTITADPSGRFVYLSSIDGAAVWQFTITATGSLTPGGSVSVPGGATGIAADPSGRFLYVASAGTNELLAFAINQTTGVLTLLQAMPAGGQPMAVVVDPQGRTVYVSSLVTSTIHPFAIDPATGLLIALPVAPAAGGVYDLGISR